ncbi:MAG: hypothetical protein HC836_23215 [Richelia sp. RM2_1_2]|nr:hypothetical protein [Richelia sp. RM2_1_2]
MKNIDDKLSPKVQKAYEKLLNRCESILNEMQEEVELIKNDKFINNTNRKEE